jgi:hypothetical protein
MSWSSKEQQTSFDATPIEGLFFLDGDILARVIGVDWAKGMKYSMIAFPSGMECEIWEGKMPTIHLFGEMDLPLNDTHERALQHATSIARAVGYLAMTRGDTQLELRGFDDDEHLLVTYDNHAQRMVDVAAIPSSESPAPIPTILLDAQSRERLPKLYTGEHLGLQALAQVKFFTPDASWTWYASEFDGGDIFFGLVVGFEIELGYFSLSELLEVRGQLGLPVERDRFFKPTTLAELKAKHEQDNS